MSSDSVKIPVKNVDGGDLNERSISASQLDTRVRYRLLKEAVVRYEANRRSGTHKVKSRGEVAGSKQKPWRQKGTGRARSGSRKSPVWKGGGVIFGPRPRSYALGMNRKQRRLALRSAVYSKFRDGQVLVLEGLDLPQPKTKVLAEALNACGVHGSCLLGTVDHDRTMVLSGRNIPGVQVAPVKDWNAADVLRAETLVLLPGALEALTSDDGGEGDE